MNKRSFLSRPPINNVGKPGIRGRPIGAFSKVASGEYLDQIDHGHGHELQSPAEAVLHRLGTNRTPTHWACISTHRPSTSSIMPSLGMEIGKGTTTPRGRPENDRNRGKKSHGVEYSLRPQSTKWSQYTCYILPWSSISQSMPYSPSFMKEI
ncbi:hypothetical protein BO83DRAFT_144809 [Aspergillus eucalypticola CBS 122712]|uniref:Uncharacterized protein n=1 Tax=Aspergillus eucalypticola (strain CBS 122712 / IBT 29274) TaxID=1448314 RepID=A0A317USM6_ASPEC|nr:uncharacterized protein BO83DRAFT_144809 [Aspergillus eucalypticola CBS 122712]PWY64128.1 hypothetical protein BO83DRAFT_144809 [Aspergillus eucalypticola CBS 122712]